MNRTEIETDTLSIKLDEEDTNRLHGRLHLFGEIANHTEGRRLAKEALKAAGVGYQGISFSQRAGCSCGCSPGYIVKGAGNFSLYVDIKEN